jgi:hypothetical protein
MECIEDISNVCDDGFGTLPLDDFFFTKACDLLERNICESF